VEHLSGSVVQTSRLGLPSLPGSDNAAALTWQTLVLGTHTARIWFDGPDHQRLALLGQLSESDIVHSGLDVWTYASDTQKVGHKVLDKAKPGTSPEPAAKDLKTYTPQGAADQALAAIDPSTVVTVDRTARVAGRPAYTLVLSPRDSRSTVRKVSIAVDAKYNVPLRVQVYGAAAKPAFEIGFSDVSFSRPAASIFHFTPPKGSTVSSDLWAATNRRMHHEVAPPPAGSTAPLATAPKPAGKPAAPTTIGTGWTSVLSMAAPTDGSSPTFALAGPNAELLGRLTQTLANGDRLIRTALLNVLVTKDGRVLLGAVSPAFLQQVAGHNG
jgi:outer membrane lipoprotein-sorting protein